MTAPTLADKLGLPTPASPILQKAKRLGLDSSELLEGLAVARGCSHYSRPGAPDAPVVSESEFSNEELTTALLSPSLPYSPHTIRVGAAMLGATGNDVDSVIRLTSAEGCVGVVRYIANAALSFEPRNPFWRQLLDRLPDAPSIEDGVMPHPTRFVSMTGMTRSGVQRVTVWLRPRPDLAPTHG